ncbi:hypothetical protein OF83DRAFT_1136949 [Amylostereum chailletii]|nr:hypothetical protein OF83DRAFT_1136949 [Amylostereum chailletii]
MSSVEMPHPSAVTIAQPTPKHFHQQAAEKIQRTRSPMNKYIPFPITIPASTPLARHTTMSPPPLPGTPFQTSKPYDYPFSPPMAPSHSQAMGYRPSLYTPVATQPEATPPSLPATSPSRRFTTSKRILQLRSHVHEPPVPPGCENRRLVSSGARGTYRASVGA